jgi:hypothetical protein
MDRRTLRGLLIALLVAGLGLWLGINDSQPTEAAARAKPQSKPIRAAYLKPKEHTPIVDLAAVPTVPAAAIEDDDTTRAEAEAHNDSDGERTEADRRAEEHLVLQRTYFELDARFEEQQIDRVWGSAAESNLSEAFRRTHAEERLQVESVECGSELCKSVLTFDDEQASQRFVHAFAVNSPPGLGHHFKYEGPQATIYSTRRDDALGR